MKRLLKFAFQSFFRNFWLSVVTVIIVSLSLFSISFLLMVNILTQHVLEVVEDRTEVFIDLTAEATDEQAEVLVSELNKLPAIKESIFVTPEQTLVDFTSRHSHDPLMIESLDALEENPFQGSIKLTVHDIGDFPAILSELSKEEYTPFLEIEDNEFTEAKLLIERISDYSVKVQKTFFFISLLFIIISVLVVFNTIQIGIYTHREEIGIMKLVGASNSFIRSPFLIEGFFYSFIGFILLLILLYPFLSFIQSYIDGFFGEYSLNLISALNSNFIKVFASEFFVAIIITMASSLLAVRRYLKV
ncbi:FtsX-like permease family protein [bacterium]|jgi:cell division transport system permease protein|nr:FtsX-like permease family protein [bacterium]MBT4122014.1 FtsX-like permease family protein [bacterium]MBT4334936.1 FtsX-like permease family protein [bacterium]MBT4495359.1 FtsX-like permease family protein [bacterium]MBT4764160.1 FtsX-like permease family protein [bacterium]